MSIDCIKSLSTPKLIPENFNFSKMNSLLIEA